jgi:hypothetical protein
MNKTVWLSTVGLLTLAVALAVYLGTRGLGAGHTEEPPPAPAAPSPGGEDAELKALVEKILKAHGGEERLRRVKYITLKSTAVLHVFGGDHKAVEVSYTALPDRWRLDSSGEGVRLLQVLLPDKGWVKRDNRATQEMAKKDFTELRDQFFHSKLITIFLPLKDPAVTLTSLGETKVGGRLTLGIKVAHKDHPDIQMFVDKEKGLLVKTAVRFREAGAMEYFFDEPKEIEGILVYMEMSVKQRGKTTCDSEVTEVNFKDELPDTLFAKP